MCSPSRRAQMSIEFLIISFFALAIILSLFSIYANMRSSWAGGAEERQAQTIVDRLADAMVEVGQGPEGSEVEVSLTDAAWLELRVQERSLWALWDSHGAQRVVSCPILTDDVDFDVGERVLVVKEDGI